MQIRMAELKSLIREEIEGTTKGFVEAVLARLLCRTLTERFGEDPSQP